MPGDRYQKNDKLHRVRECDSVSSVDETDSNDDFVWLC